MLQLSDLLWHVDGRATTHAINPETKKTYCGFSALVLDNWRPIDELVSDEHQPTCKICQRHFKKKEL